ncbi:MAG TPA: nitrogen fixation protein FixH [Gammaproteobacteria bacterium]|nr:nitrogen fixation protein FixH [Gammaproteobacteria bacterium]
MLHSLLALPLGAVLEVLVFLALYLLTPMSGRQAALAVALLSVTAVMIYSLINWPGADVIAMYVAVLAVTAYLLGIVSYSREQRLAASGGRGDGRWFHWGPAVIILFFITLFAVDGVMVVISSQGLPKPLAGLLLPESAAQKQVRSAFPGTVANDFQKKEGLYNEYLQQVERQQQRGWQVSKGWLVEPVAGQQVPFQVRVSEQDGAPVRFAQLSGTFQRPSDSRLDQTFEMGEVEPGLYRVVLSLPQPGVWNLVLKIKRGEQLHELHASTSVAEPGPKP